MNIRKVWRDISYTNNKNYIKYGVRFLCVLSTFFYSVRIKHKNFLVKESVVTPYTCCHISKTTW